MGVVFSFRNMRLHALSVQSHLTQTQILKSQGTWALLISTLCPWHGILARFPEWYYDKALVTYRNKSHTMQHHLQMCNSLGIFKNRDNKDATI